MAPLQGRFEGQLKQRLQFALLPRMIAHEFPISQQKPSPRAADMLELYAPLFATLAGKEQVLIPHFLNLPISCRGGETASLPGAGNKKERKPARGGAGGAE
ncbi:MAG: hypothetical protein WB763_03915 [Terriglobia bacterium]|jgi:hypothetical protein